MLVTEVANKGIRDNCRRMSVEDTHIRAIGAIPITMFEQVCADLETRRVSGNGAVVMGAHYWHRMRVMYMSPTNALAMLVVPQPPEIVAPALIRAMIAAKKARPDHTLMVTLLGISEHFPWPDFILAQCMEDISKFN